MSPTPKTSEKPRKPRPGRSGGGALQTGKHGGNQGGRPTSLVRQTAQQLADKYKLMDRLAQIAAGEQVQVFRGVDDKTGEPIVEDAPARIGDQIDAAELVLAYAHGRPTESIDVNEATFNFVVVAPKRAETVEDWMREYVDPLKHKVAIQTTGKRK